MYTIKEIIFSFKINFPFLISNIPTNPTFDVYMSQLVRIGIIISKLVNQVFWYCKLCKTFKMFLYWYINLVPV